MAQEPERSSAVPLVTTAYLAQSFQTDQQPAADPVPPAADSTLAVLQPLARILSGLLVCIAVIALPLTFLSAAPKENDRPRCGVDWLFWAAGSDKTFESVLTDNLDCSRRDVERQMEESRSKVKPFEIKPFDSKSLQWNPPLGNRK